MIFSGDKQQIRDDFLLNITYLSQNPHFEQLWLLHSRQVHRCGGMSCMLHPQYTNAMWLYSMLCTYVESCTGYSSMSNKGFPVQVLQNGWNACWPLRCHSVAPRWVGLHWIFSRYFTSSARCWSQRQIEHVLQREPDINGIDLHVPTVSGTGWDVPLEEFGVLPWEHWTTYCLWSLTYSIWSILVVNLFNVNTL